MTLQDVYNTAFGSPDFQNRVFAALLEVVWNKATTGTADEKRAASKIINSFGTIAFAVTKLAAGAGLTQASTDVVIQNGLSSNFGKIVELFVLSAT